ncbi:MAG: DUF4355 domain-containing protein [Monoglobales bacterium]
MKFGKPKFDKEKFDKKEFDNEKVEKKETAKNDEGKNGDYEDSQKERAYEKEDNGGELEEKEDDKDLNTERMEFEAQKELMKQELPLEFAPMLAGADVEETMENVAMFKKLFLKAVEKTLSERLKGSEPKTGGIDEDDGSDPFLRGFGF